MDITEYGNGWVGYTPMGPPLPRGMRPKPVASYRALLPGDGSASSLLFAAGVDGSDLVAALNQRPEYMPFRWPDRELNADADLRALALLKILAIVSFGADWPSAEPAGILAEEMVERPDLSSWPAPWVQATGEVFLNGDSDAGFADLEDDDPHPCLDIIGGSDDRLLAALAAADLIRLIRTEPPSWDPFGSSAKPHRSGAPSGEF